MRKPFELPPVSSGACLDIARNQAEYGNVWRGVAQSFTALEERTVFSLFYVATQPDRMAVDLLLLEGELGSLSPVLTVSAGGEAGGLNRHRVLDFDLGAPALVPGKRYTALFTPGPGNLPEPGSVAGAGVEFGSTPGDYRPYSGGAFYFYGIGGSNDITSRITS